MINNYIFIVTVKHFNFHWQDMTTPSIATMTEIANIGSLEINRGGKVRTCSCFGHA